MPDLQAIDAASMRAAARLAQRWNSKDAARFARQEYRNSIVRRYPEHCLSHQACEIQHYRRCGNNVLGPRARSLSPCSQLFTSLMQYRQKHLEFDRRCGTNIVERSAARR